MMTDEGYVPLAGGFDVFPIVLERYAESDELTGAQAEADKIADLLGRYGGVLHPWDVPPEERDLLAAKSRLDEWAKATRSSVLLWLGHGKTTSGQARLLVPRSADADELIPPATLTDKLVDLLKRREQNFWVMVVVEACSASAFVDEMWTPLTWRRRAGVLLVGSGAAGGNGYLGSFRRALASICDDDEQARYTSHDVDISLADFAAGFFEKLSRSDSVYCGQVAGFDPFARRRRSIAPLTAPVDVFGRLRRELDQLPAADQARLRVPVSLGEFGGPLAGRSAEIKTITGFLRRAAGGTLVVTGQPGSGKSALLSSILLAAHQDMHRGLTELGLAAPGAVGRVEISGSLLLTGASLHDVIADVAGIAGVPLPTGTPAASQSAAALLAAVRRRDQPLRLVMDSLDEAADPLATAALIRELSEAGPVSLVVGTRPRTAADAGRAADDLIVGLGVPDGQVLELGQDAEAVTSFVSDRLRADPRFRQARGGNERTDAAVIAEAVADAAARRSPGDFLLARLLIEEFLADPEMALDGEVFDRLLELDHDQAFAAALARITAGCPPADPCLRALALSCGRGVPRAGSVWETMAHALAPDESTQLTEGDLDEVLNRAGAYVMLDYVDGQSVYRLAHRVFRDHLATHAGEQDDAVARALLGLAGRQDELGPYLRRYLPAHLARLGEPGWALLEAAPEVLDRLDLPSLVTAAQSAPSGLSHLPPNVAGAVVTSHLAAVSTTADRPGLRQLGAARVSARWPREQRPDAAWSLAEARLRPQRIHLTLPGHRGPVYGLAMTERAGRRLLASGGEDGTVRLWDPESGWQLRSDVVGHAGPVRGLAALTLDREVPVLALAGVRDPLRTFEALTGRQLDALQVTEAGQYSAVISFRGRDGAMRLAVANDQGGIRVLSAAPLRFLGERMTGHVGGVAGLVTVPMPDGRILVATGGHDRTIRLWDPERYRQVLPTWHGSASPVTSICVLSATDGPQLVTGHEDGEICCWDPVAGPLPGGVRTGSRRLVVAALPGAGRMVAAAGSDRVVRVWDLDAGQPVGPDGIGHDRPVIRILALPGTGRFATAGDDGTIRIWEADGSPQRGTVPPGRPARARNRRTWRSAPGQPEWTVTAGDDGALTYTAPAQPTWTFPGMGVLARAALVVTIPAGRRLLAVAENSAVRLWDLDRGGLYGILNGHDGVCAMTQAPAPGGPPVLVVGADDGTLRVWEIVDRRLRHVVRLGSRVLGLQTDNGTVRVSLDEGEIAIELNPDGFCVDGDPRG